jgi:hypothetical protein
MSFTWSIYEEKEKPEVQDFVKSTSGSFFHEPSFFQYHRIGRFNFLNFICRKKNKVVAWIPGHQDGDTFTSPAGASYGGPLFSKTLTLNNQLTILNDFLSKYNSIFLNINFITPPNIYFGDTGFLLSAVGFKYTNRLCCHALHLAGNEWPEVMSKSKRYDYRKVNDKGVLFGELNRESYSDFFELLEKQNQRQKSQATHTLQEILKLKLLLPKRIKIFASTLNNKIKAAALIFLINEKVAYTFYIVNGDMAERGIVTHLIVNLAEHFRKKHFNWLDLGPSSCNNFVLNEGLADFKKKVGGILLTRDKWSYSQKVI